MNAKITELRNISGWVAFLDVYGFEAEILAVPAEKIAERMLALHNHFHAERAKTKGTEGFFFSDSAVLVRQVEPSATKREWVEELGELAKIIEGFLNAGLKAEFVFRGAICKGEITFASDICIGKPLVEAYRTEQQLALPLVVVPASQLTSFEHERPTHWLEMPLPMKDGVMSGYPVLPAPTDELSAFAQERYREHSKKGPYHVAKVWAELDQFLDRFRGMLHDDTQPQ